MNSQSLARTRITAWILCSAVGAAIASDFPRGPAPSVWEPFINGWSLSAPSSVTVSIDTLDMGDGDSLIAPIIHFIGTGYRRVLIHEQAEELDLILRETIETTDRPIVDGGCGDLLVEAWPVSRFTEAPIWTIRSSGGCETSIVSMPGGDLYHVDGQDHSGDWVADSVFDLASGRLLFHYHDQLLTVFIAKTALRRFVTSYFDRESSSLPLVADKRAIAMIHYGPRPESEDIVLYAPRNVFHDETEIWFATPTRDGRSETALPLVAATGVADPSHFGGFSIVIQCRTYLDDRRQEHEALTFEIPVELDRMRPENTTFPTGIEFRRIND